MNGEQKFYEQLRGSCKRWVKQAAQILAAEEGHQTVAVQKDAVDLSTSADIAAEKFYIEQIKHKYPDHGIYSEEAGEVTDVRDFTWSIDPLDGTKEFARGGKEYNTLLAVEHLGDLVACATYRNGIDTMYSASRGGGATRNGKPISVSQTAELDKAFIGYHVPTRYNREDQITLGVRLLEQLIRVSYRVRPGWDDAHYAAWVAKGLIDAHVVAADVNHWYDVAPSILLVSEAGGKVTDWNGDPIVNHNLSHGIIFSNGKLHDQILTLVKKSTK